MDKLKQAIDKMNDIEWDISLKYEDTNPKLESAVCLARQALQEKLERDNPTPLTLAQLKGMEGQIDNLVWLQDIKDDRYSDWLGAFDFQKEGVYEGYLRGWLIGDEVDEFYNLADYGITWVAYAHKPNPIEGE